MARIAVDGLEIEYDLIGDAGAPGIALTPGGRFARDKTGVPELARALADQGFRALTWDRPNCGGSDVSFDAPNESEMHGQVLSGLVRALDMGPTVMAAGTGGARVAMIAASRDPEITSHLVLWWISGGVTGLLSLANYYCVNQAIAASRGGMEAVAALPAWDEQIARNPRARETLLALDPKEFIATMEDWSLFFLPQEGTPVPGMNAEDFALLTMPTLIFRNGESDLAHPRKTSDWVEKLIPHAEIMDPPWPDDQWNLVAGKPDMYAAWEKLAPTIADFVRRS